MEVKLITSIGIGLMTGIPVAWVLKVLYNSFIAPFKRTKLLIKAREEGRMVVGHLVDFHFHQSNENAGVYENKVYGVYEFEVKVGSTGINNGCRVCHLRRNYFITSIIQTKLVRNKISVF